MGYFSSGGEGGKKVLPEGHGRRREGFVLV